MDSHRQIIKQMDLAVENDTSLMPFWQNLQQREDLEVLFMYFDSLAPLSIIRALSQVKSIEQKDPDRSKESNAFLPAYQIMRAYLEGAFAVGNGVKAFDVDTRLADLGEELAGLVYYSSSGIYTVLVNTALDEYEQETLAFQEIKRITEHVPRQLRLIGMDFMNHLDSGMDEFMEAIFNFRF